MNLSLSHKTALVCGITQRIGKTKGSELASLWANIVLLARNEDKLTELDSSQGQKYGFLVADFS